MNKDRDRPKFRSVLFLKCPYCLNTKLRKSGSWTTFATGCHHCHYAFEPKSDYFRGSFWLVNLPISGIITMALWAFIQEFYTGSQLAAITIVASLIAIWLSLTFLMSPYSKALWLFVDHAFKPLHERDSA